LRYVKLPEENFEEFFKSLKGWGKVYGPVKQGNIHSFKKVDDLDEISLNYTRTMLPPKKFFVKPKDEMLKLKEGGWIVENEVEKTVLFGVHSCDIHGLQILDKVYLSEPEDPYYKARRENTVIVGISCMPDEYCFCKSLGTDFAMHGFDLFLHELPDGWLVRVGSVKGHEIAWENEELFENVSEEDFHPITLENLKRRELMLLNDL